MSVERFLEMLAGDKNTLVRPSLWDDPFEKLINESAVLKDEQSSLKIIPAKFAESKLSADKWFGQCWSLEEESDALWRVFTQNKIQRSVKIVTTYGKLKESINGIEEGVVKFFIDRIAYPKSFKSSYGKALVEWMEYYKQVGLPLENLCELSLLLTKRYLFKHEKEVRLLAFVKDKNLLPNPHDNIYSYNYSVENNITEVELDPWMPEYTKKIVSVVAMSKGLTVRESQLSQEISPGKGILFEIRNSIKLHKTQYDGGHSKVFSFSYDGKGVEISNLANKKSMAKGKLKV